VVSGVVPRLVSPDLAGYAAAARPGPDGSFEFDGVPTGTYNLYASRTIAGGTGAAGIVASASTTVEVRGGSVEGLLLRMKPSVELQGKVTYQSPCYATGTTVTLGPSRSGFPVGTPQATVSSDSTFTLSHVPPGSYYALFGDGGRCYVKSVSYRGQPASPDALLIDASGTLQITLTPFTSVLDVEVVGHDGRALPHAQIVVTAMDDAQVASGYTRDTGQDRITYLPPGTYRVYAFEMVQQIVTPNSDYLKALESRANTVTLGATGTATVRVAAIPASETGGAAPPAESK
jgi:hypothetical protein